MIDSAPIPSGVLTQGKSTESGRRLFSAARLTVAAVAISIAAALAYGFGSRTTHWWIVALLALPAVGSWFRSVVLRRKLEASMSWRAYHDTLTGLGNRRLLVERLEAALQRPRPAGRVHALISADVDRFKAINHSLGNDTGDGILVAVGDRMAGAVGTDALLARFGSDEFVVFLEDVDGIREAIAVAQRVCDAMDDPLVLDDGREIVPTVSIGITLVEPGQGADDALRDAGVAMHRAKGRGGTYQVFDKALMGIRSTERLELEAALRKGIERGEFEVHYQPVVSVADQRVVGAEALVRWRHPVDGMVAPDRFVPVAEESGLILSIGQFVLEDACAFINELRSRLGVDLPISVNLSPRQ
ncbi:MAG: diguanylate cyclase, partial [Acidimicrobiales bacterium]|nr:diguanylate cyclase [Acidimicrobiales bacterium]